MSRAEIFKIIDVLPVPGSEQDRAPEVHPEPSPHEANGKGATARVRRDHLALWSSPTAEAVVVPIPLSQPGPIIDLEYVSLPDTLDDRLVMLTEPDSARARSFRLLRHRLLSREDPRVVAVVSACPGEGKTTCAFNLAAALAEDTMMRVLLLEANLARPALARMLDFVPQESLVEHITRFAEVGPPYPVAALSGTRLHVAALPPSSLPDVRLDRTLFSVALHDLRGAYDYIVIDAASVLESGDADVVGECAGGVLLATRTGVSRRADLRRAVAEVAPARVLGAVLLDA